MGNTLDPVKMIPIVRCEDCPFGIVKEAMSDKPIFVCRHPILGKTEKVIKKDTYKNMPTKPPEWCELTSFSELVLRNRHDIIKIIEDSYGPLDISPFKKPSPSKRPVDGDDMGGPWIGKTYYKKYWEDRMRSMQKSTGTMRYTVGNQWRGKADPKYLPWRKRLNKYSSPKRMKKTIT